MKEEPLCKTTSIKQIVQNFASKRVKKISSTPCKKLDFMLHHTICRQHNGFIRAVVCDITLLMKASYASSPPTTTHLSSEMRISALKPSLRLPLAHFSVSALPVCSLQRAGAVRVDLPVSLPPRALHDSAAHTQSARLPWPCSKPGTLCLISSTVM